MRRYSANTVLSITHLLSVSRARVRLIKWVYKPLLSIVGATALSRVIFSAIPLFGGSIGMCVTVHCLLTLALYLLFLMLTGCFDQDDRTWVASLFAHKCRNDIPPD